MTVCKMEIILFWYSANNKILLRKNRSSPISITSNTRNPAALERQYLNQGGQKPPIYYF